MAENEITNEKAAKHIWNNALQRSFQPFSWGLDFSSVKTIENGTAFHVKAAWVQIQYMRKVDLFKVTIIPDDKQKNQIVCERLILDNLVPTIDDAVKHGSLSDKSICKEYGIIPKRLAV